MVNAVLHVVGLLYFFVFLGISCGSSLICVTFCSFDLEVGQVWFFFKFHFLYTFWVVQSLRLV